VPWFLIETVALATALPDGSVINPESVAPDTCACTVTDQGRLQANIISEIATTPIHFILFIPTIIIPPSWFSLRSLAVMFYGVSSTPLS
jgi:hypothetical protein